MHAVDFVDGEPVHQAIPHHGAAAGPAFLGRLEDHDSSAGEVAGFGKIFGGTQQHGGMAVMATGVHLSRYRRPVGQVVRLLDRQCVHVGAQSDHLAPHPPRL